MTIVAANLFADLPKPETGEAFAEVLRRGNVHIERIVSSAAPEPVLYDQTQDEWVLLLTGAATIDVAGEVLELTAGDHLFIPAHCPHRLLATSADPPCVWLAVHIWPTAAVSDDDEGAR
jgi:cupin 2 domain-containing protein